MKFNINIICFAILIFFSGCSKEEKVSVLQKKNLDEQMVEVYQEAMKEFERGDVIYAGKNLVKQSYFILNRFGPLELF